MRTWRVGTISMGLSLILLGGIIFYSTMVEQISAYQLLLSWWPVILIVLGVEMLIYFALNKKEEGRIKYDFLSVFFVGVLGTIALSFMFLSFSGIDKELRDGLRSTNYSFDLPVYHEESTSQIDRVVIQVEEGPLTIETSEQEGVQVFGTYQSDSEEIRLEKPEDYLFSYVDGNVLYLTFKALPKKNGWYSYQMRMNPTFIIPKDVNLEVRAKNYGTVTLYPRDLAANWTVLAGYVEAYVEEESDYTLAASKIITRDNGEERLETKTTGEGTYAVYVTATDDVAIYNMP